MNDKNDKIKIVYVTGLGRSGSTLLARLLGEMDGFINIGEGVGQLFNIKRMARNLPCGCGERLSECKFWKNIVSHIDRNAQEYGMKVLRIRYLPLLMCPLKPHFFKNRLKRLLSKIKHLYASVAEKSSCNIIIDSSKNPVNAYILSKIPDIELCIVHIVRDPRAIVSSRTKSKQYLDSFSPLKVILLWWIFNFLTETLLFQVRKFFLIRYEDFVKSPKDILERISRDVTEKEMDAGYISKNHATINLQHMIAGNPDKLTHGQLAIKYHKWHLPWHLQGLVWLSTFPLFHKYRYSLFHRKE